MDQGIIIGNICVHNLGSRSGKEASDNPINNFWDKHECKYCRNTNERMYILGPSHINADYTSILCREEKARLFGNMILEGHKGLPNWSEYIPETLKKYKDQGHQLVWMVSDWKFNNSDYEILQESGKRLNTLGGAGNISKKHMTEEITEFLGNHSIKMINEIIEDYPGIKLIFWCLYTRTYIKDKSSYPIHLQYPAIKDRYASNIIDIDAFTTPQEFKSLIRDEGGHPNVRGYELLSEMVKSIECCIAE